MGKSPQEFVPVKYANSSEQTDGQMMNYMIGGAFVLLLIQLYRNKHGKGGAGAAGKGGSTKGGGPLGGRGGMNDMFKMGNSNV